MRLIKTKKNFHSEFKRQLRYAIAAAVGFLIAFTWRDTIFNSMMKLISWMGATNKESIAGITASIVITIIGVIIIIISSRILRD